MPDSAVCPNCKLTLPFGQQECPNCGTIISQDLGGEILPMPVEPVKKATRKSKPKKIVIVPLESYREILGEAQQKEESGDLAGALTVYRRALAFVEVNQKADPSLELAVQTLGILIQRTEHLLAQQTAPVVLTDMSAAESAPEAVQLVEPPLGQAITSASIPLEVPETTPLLPPLPRDSAPIEHPVGISQATIPECIQEPVSTALSHSPKRADRTKVVISVVGGVVSLILFCVVVGLGVNSSKLMELPIFNTRTPTPTPTPLPTSTPIWDFELTDTFDSNQYGWLLENNSIFECGTESLDIQNGAMTWTIDDTQDCYWSELPSIPSAMDFDMSADIQRISGSEDSDYGLVIRQQNTSTTSDYYYFAISDNNLVYSFAVYQQNVWIGLIDWTINAAIRTGEVNRLRVTGQGSHFTFYINGQKIATYDDSKLSQGQFGLAGEPRGAAATLKLIIDNFELHGNH